MGIKSLHAVIAALSVSAALIPAGGETILEENFSNLDGWTDLSTLISWGGRSAAGTSCFTTGSEGGTTAVSMTSDGMSHAGYSGGDDLKTFSALDFVFPDPILHRDATLTVSFDARWDDVRPSEKGRFMVVLMDEYPEGGVRGEDLSDFEGDPYGTPALHVRIRPGMTTLLQYGGGHGGEYEKYGGAWWLPGFIQNALPASCDGSCGNPCGGTQCPECCGSPGHDNSNAWPDGSWIATEGNVCGTSWKRFAYRIEPERQVLEVDGEEVVAMPLPDTQPSAPGYEYYERFVAMRLYWRGLENAYIAELSVARSDATRADAAARPRPGRPASPAPRVIHPSHRHHGGVLYDIRGRALGGRRGEGVMVAVE
jgi:hypothetical protein